MKKEQKLSDFERDNFYVLSNQKNYWSNKNITKTIDGLNHDCPLPKI